jgi:hypothetical protein
MATDARISTGFPAHPKTKKLRRRLGDSGPLACMYLFLWAAANRSDGDLSGLSDEDIELAVDWEGDHGALVAELVAVGFLDGDECSRRIHDWAEHNPWAAGADARSEKARWAALCKQHGRREAARMMPEYAARLLDASPESATSKLGAVLDGASSTPLAESRSAPSPSPSPSPSPKEQKQARERAQPLPRPDDVPEQTWTDWLLLRKAVKAPVTQTVLKQARSEAEKAGLTLDRFLEVWCARGSRGLQADWLKPHERSREPDRPQRREL